MKVDHNRLTVFSSLLFQTMRMCVTQRHKFGLFTGTAEPIFNWGGLGNKRWGREFVGGSGGILTQKNFEI